MQLFQFFMDKKGNRMKHRTRRKLKLSQKMVFVMMGSCLTFVIIGLTLFLHISRVDKSTATTKQIFMEEQDYTVEKILVSPVLKATSDENVQLIRRVKEIPITKSNSE